MHQFLAALEHSICRHAVHYKALAVFGFNYTVLNGFRPTPTMFDALFNSCRGNPQQLRKIYNVSEYMGYQFLVPRFILEKDLEVLEKLINGLSTTEEGNKLLDIVSFSAPEFFVDACRKIFVKVEPNEHSYRLVMKYFGRKARRIDLVVKTYLALQSPNNPELFNEIPIPPLAGVETPNIDTNVILIAALASHRNPSMILNYITAHGKNVTDEIFILAMRRISMHTQFNISKLSIQLFDYYCNLNRSPLKELYEGVAISYFRERNLKEGLRWLNKVRSIGDPSSELIQRYVRCLLRKKEIKNVFSLYDEMKIKTPSVIIDLLDFISSPNNFCYLLKSGISEMNLDKFVVQLWNDFQPFQHRRIIRANSAVIRYWMYRKQFERAEQAVREAPIDNISKRPDMLLDFAMYGVKEKGFAYILQLIRSFDCNPSHQESLTRELRIAAIDGLLDPTEFEPKASNYKENGSRIIIHFVHKYVNNEFGLNLQYKLETFKTQLDQVKGLEANGISIYDLLYQEYNTTLQDNGFRRI